MTISAAALAFAGWDAIVTLDSERRVTGWNSAAETLLGWTQAHVLGKWIFEFLLIEEYCPGTGNSSEDLAADLYGKRWRCWALARDGRQVRIELIVLRSASSQSDRIGFMRGIVSETSPTTVAANDRVELDARDKISGLTQRQSEVLVLMFSGLSNREIGGRLGIAQRTIETHRREVLARLGVATSAEAIALAFAAGVRPAA